MVSIVAAVIKINLDEKWIEQGYPEFLIVSAPPPARHYSLLHPLFEMLDRGTGPNDQGFLTSEGQYVDRGEALELAVVANQVNRSDRRSGSSSTDLFSEDIW